MKSNKDKWNNKEEGLKTIVRKLVAWIVMLLITLMLVAILAQYQDYQHAAL